MAKSTNKPNLTDRDVLLPKGTRVYYAIVTLDGQIKRRARTASARARSGTGSLYTDQAVAENQATGHGDSVVKVYLSMDQEPVFTRLKKLETQ